MLPLFLLVQEKLESLHCLTNPFKCPAAVLLLVLISKRMGLAGLSEVINIRGHKVMVIEWAPHCNAQEVFLFTPNPALSNPTILSLFLLGASQTSPWETVYWCWLFPLTALRKQALSEVDRGAAERV